ncbi:2-C-methyl-D-erythritol 2,4-cyclodiphosphate synthase [Candidatus Blochmanniella vafra str. BVAF]|uniref:2-C-methyl-D-erythritol 2,4-cyclodiphosphate synthase n=1 Tax=Blochmanniella vafra (strain BVAF) TaxID=859654 RepID=E8Q5S8_BLOVB|nr:2-C-methyl-D-erythritol 2,4-cyclodiphosphate synthase [Candidatus Blochmannia vafer]ADV33575.1 2-C-methyl-D-erythritol 2,4-cyclodiphosphate synthase [Candidatus Blochmannia vafer str. BVAF]
MIRIGHGFDVHRFGGCRPLIIGGVLVPFEKKVVAHSDGDVVIHSIIDALLGASSNRDIGTLFSDTDSRYNNINSRILLRTVWNKISDQGYSIGNIDVTVILQQPTIQKYISQMIYYLSQDLNCVLSAINIKATTTEDLGYIGRSEGIACTAIVLLKK